MVLLIGDGDTPSPRIECPKCGSEDEGSPEINLTQPKLPQEQEEIEEDQEMRGVDHDPTRSEGMIEYKIPEFSKITGKLLSPVMYIRDMPWLEMILIISLCITVTMNLCTLCI